jgi:hypothetical protein
MDDMPCHNAMPVWRGRPPPACRQHPGCGYAGFPERPWGPQENASLGTALDPKLEAGRPRALPALESRGFCARIGDG